MTKTSFFIILFSLVFSFQANATRSMYVDGFATILGDQTAEDELLSYSQANDIEILLLYEIHIVHGTVDLSDPNTNTILANFISRAKNDFGISKIGAIGETFNFFNDLIQVYNLSRSSPDEKFDIYNLEFEFWIPSATDPGGYYCDTYLTPNGFPCNTDGAFQFALDQLQSIDSLANTSIHTISTEAYIGWLNQSQANLYKSYTDRLLVHAYVADPSTSFSYVENRLLDLTFTGGTDISIIFSSEPSFMGSWLTSNSMIAAETIFYDDWQVASANWINNMNLVGFTYFAYGFNDNVSVSTAELDGNENSAVYPNPVENNLNLDFGKEIESVFIYDNTGRLIIETSDSTIDCSQLHAGIYTVRIKTSNKWYSERIIKN